MSPVPERNEGKWRKEKSNCRRNKGNIPRNGGRTHMLIVQLRSQKTMNDAMITCPSKTNYGETQMIFAVGSWEKSVWRPFNLFFWSRRFKPVPLTVLVIKNFYKTQNKTHTKTIKQQKQKQTRSIILSLPELKSFILINDLHQSLVSGAD